MYLITDSIRPLFHHVYSLVRTQPLTSFWPDCLTTPTFEDLTDETKFIKRKTVLPVLNTFIKNNLKKIEKSKTEPAASVNPPVNDRLQSEQEKEIEDIVGDDEDDLFAPPPPLTNSRKRLRTETGVKQKVKLKIDRDDRELFCLARTLGTKEYVGQRVLQVANILRNLSFTEDNMKMLANNITFLRFLLLCTNARWNTLHQYGFDMLSNVALQVALKDPIRDRLSECLLLTITDGVSSDDRYVIMSCLDILNKLCQNESNEDVLLRYLEQSVSAL